MSPPDQTEREVQDWPFWRKQGAILANGGLLDPRTLDVWHRTTCGYVRHAFRSILSAHADSEFAEQFDKLTLVFVGSSKSNAIALERQGRRAVIVTIGLVRQLWSKIQEALCGEQFLKSTFDSEAPTSKAETSRGQDRHLGDDWPEDRRLVLHELFAHAVEFLVCHELAHHARGHLPYLKLRQGAELIDETLNAQSDGTGSLLLRNIEFDADFHAVDLLIEGLEQNSNLGSWSEEHARMEHYLRLIAIIAFFQMFDRAHLPIDRQYRDTHPPIVHRAVRVTGVLSKAMTHELNWSNTRRIDEHDNAWFAAAQLAQQSGMPPGRWHGVGHHRMGLARLNREERKFIAFSRELDRFNKDENA